MWLPKIQIANPNEPTHNHCEDSSMTEHIGIRRDMQEVVAQNPTLPVRRIYDGEVARLHRQGGGDRPTIPNFSSVKSSIERRRRAMMPPISATLADVQIAGPWAETWLGSRYIRNTYVGQAATFPPDVWNVFNRDMSQHTNNNVEGVQAGREPWRGSVTAGPGLHRTGLSAGCLVD
ncbi:hypothetical protein ACOMHN_015758 [Nucella lapillus]